MEEINCPEVFKSKDILTRKDIKEYYGMGSVKVQKLLERRDFPSYKVGGIWYIIKNDFLKWEQQQTKKLRYRL